MLDRYEEGEELIYVWGVFDFDFDFVLILRAE